MSSRVKSKLIIGQFFLFLFAFFLTAYGCGGGGGGGEGESSATKQGIFVDGPVEGLEYKTATLSGVPDLSGVTDANGTFEYREEEVKHYEEIFIVGQLITFSVGDIVLGHGIAKEQITPVDLVDVAHEQQNPEENPTVTNISRFLISLDVDGDPDNGITISQEIREACAGRSIDFTQSVADFETDPDVLGLFVTLNGQGVFSDETERKLCPAQRSRIHLRNSLRELRSILVKTWEWIDSNNDEKDDEVAKYTYDTNGNLIKEARDISDDGTVDYAMNYTYDPNGNLIKEERDNSNDGTIDSVTITNNTYDANGNLIITEIDLNNDEAIDLVIKFTYDANGNLIKSESEIIAFKIKSVINYTLDHNWYLIKEEHRNPVDGTIYLVINYTYNDNWCRIKEEHDRDADGKIDYLKKITYDRDGNRIKEEGDSDGDGKIDYFKNFTYVADGHWITEERDSDADGEIDYVADYQYESNYGGEDETACPDNSMGPEGGVMEVTDPGSDIYGVKVEIPKGTLLSCRTLYIDETTGYRGTSLGAGLRPICEPRLDRCVFDIETSGSPPVSMPMKMSFPTGEISVGSGEILCAFYYDDAKGKWQIALPEEVDNDKMTINTTYKKLWSWGKVVLAEVEIETLEPLLDEMFGPDYVGGLEATIETTIGNEIVQLITWFRNYCDNRFEIGNFIKDIKEGAKTRAEGYLQIVNNECMVWGPNPTISDIFYGIDEIIEIHVQYIGQSIVAEMLDIVPYIGSVLSIVVKAQVEAVYKQRLGNLRDDYICIFTEADSELWLNVGLYYITDAILISMVLAEHYDPCAP